MTAQLAIIIMPSSDAINVCVCAARACACIAYGTAKLSEEHGSQPTLCANPMCVPVHADNQRVNKKSKVSKRLWGAKSTCEKGQHFSTFFVVYLFG